MKKVLAMFLVCAMACTLSAKTKKVLFFNRDQFQTSKADCSLEEFPALTVPFVYSGTLALDGKIAWDDDDNIYERDQCQYDTICDEDWDYTLLHWYGEGVDADSHKNCQVPGPKDEAVCYVGDYSKKLPLYMTLCQPCLDCYPCTVLGQYNGVTYLINDQGQADAVGFNKAAFVGKVTRWNLYLVDAKKGKGGWAYIYKYNLLDKDVDDSTLVDSVFFTGGLKKISQLKTKAQAGGKAYIQAKGEDFGSLVMTGAKNDYKFKYTDAVLGPDFEWYYTDNTATAYIKSVSKFDGLFCFSRMFGWDEDIENLYGFQFCGEATLTRNASLTKAAIEATFGAEKTVSSKKIKNWEDCDDPAEAHYCEEYFFSTWGDQFDNYLLDKVYTEKSYNDVAYTDEGDMFDTISAVVGVFYFEEETEEGYSYEYLEGEEEAGD
ncbi:MAG: hypothetical protein II943_11955, partial [Victivallales bacterium]|nr:hypothetical protein [Victivallales bacterium]